MAINFPDSPSTNDTHTVGDKTWTWNGTYWHLNQNSSTYYAQDGVPSDPDGGDFWFESDSGQLFVRYDSAWVEIGHATDFGSSMSDADGDTLIQLEEGSDEDIIRFDTGGTERMTIAADGAVNVGGTLTAGAFSGPLTGNVTGNASGTALTVTQAAQTAITSVGTLTGLTISGDLTVDGTTTTINSTTLTVDDKNIELGSVATPSDTTADGGGITLKGASDKTILWTNSTDTWDFNQGITVGGDIRIGGGGDLRLSDSSAAGTTANDTILYNDAETLSFWVNGAARAKIDSDGKVGIGTTAPAARLVVAEIHSAHTMPALGSMGGLFGFYNQDAVNGALKYGLIGSVEGSGNVHLQVGRVDGTASAYNLVLQQHGGKVGIGTSTPAVKFDCAGLMRCIANDSGWPASGTGLEMTYDAGDARAYLQSYDRGASAWKPITISGSSISLTQGNVGIGTTSPSYLLHLSGTDPVLRIDETAGDDDVKLQLMQSGSEGEGTELKYESGTGHTYLKSIYSAGNMYFQTAGANTRMQIAAGGKMVLSMGGDYTPAANIGVQSANGQAHPWGHIVSHGHSTVLWGTDNNGHYLGGDTKNLKFKRSCTWNAHPGSSGYVAMEIREGATQHGGTDADYGGIGFAAAGVYIDRNWGNYPGFTVCNSSVASDTNQGEFRLHGANHSYASYPAISGSDFGVVTRSDGGFATGSDERRKENITTISGALATVNSLRGVEFNTIIRDGSQETLATMGGKMYGFIAQEAKDLIPNVVTYYPDEDEPLESGWCSAYSINYAPVTAVLVEAIKELTTRLETLESA